jgi:CysZ protein
MNPISGPAYLLKGFRLILQPGLRRFFIIPLLINIVVFTIMIFFSINGFDTLMNWILPSGDGVLVNIARTVLWVIFAASALLFIFFTFTLVANLIGAPFNGVLAEKVEMYLTGEDLNSTEGVKSVMGSIGSSIRSELRKLIYFLIIALLIFLISLIPGVNFVAPVIWFLFGSWMLSIEYLSYPMENHGLFFKEVKARLAEKRLVTFTFGIVVVAVTLIPVVNFFVMPAAVAGATALWVDHWDQKERGGPSSSQPSAVPKEY